MDITKGTRVNHRTFLIVGTVKQVSGLGIREVLVEWDGFEGQAAWYTAPELSIAKELV